MATGRSDPRNGTLGAQSCCMIVTRTPFRLTLGGGGTDLPGFYERHGGYILALGIDKYMYVALNIPYADRKVRLHYLESESVDRVEDLRHDLAREALRAHGIGDAIDIASLADLPAGTGLGSSSCYLVGLLNALRTYLFRPVSAQALAEEACRIELDVLCKPIGKQDQYMAAFGGLTELVIDRLGRVSVERIPLPSYAVAEFVANTHMYYTNVQRPATDILSEQSSSLRAGREDVETAMLRIMEIGRRIGDAFRDADFDRFGRLMHEHWMEKRRLSGRVTVPIVERLYDHVRDEFGVLGGKVAGAGGGGFLMLYCPRDGARLTQFMHEQGMARLTYDAEFEGSRVIANMLSARSVHLHLDAGLRNRVPAPAHHPELETAALVRS
jgi:D-glycero-alpha-D-manno-heptose-7-phosphate kinase